MLRRKSKKVNPEKKANRNPIHQWFITWTRWYPTELVEFEKRLPPTKWGFVVEEEHDEPDKDTDRNSMVHYHASIYLTHKITFSKLIKYIQDEWPEDYKRIDIESTGDLYETTYLEKESHKTYEWGLRPTKPVKKYFCGDIYCKHKVIGEILHRNIHLEEIRKNDEASMARMMRQSDISDGYVKRWEIPLLDEMVKEYYRNGENKYPLLSVDEDDESLCESDLPT